MSRLRSSLALLGLALLPLLVAAIAPAELREFTRQVREQRGLDPWPWILTLCLALPVIPALLFNQIRLVLVCLLLGAVAVLGDPATGLPGVEARRLLIPVLALQVTTLTLLRERGLLTRYGFWRVMVVVLPLALLSWLPRLETLGLWLGRLPPGFWHSPPPGMNTPWIWLVPSLLAIAGLLRLRGTEYPVLAPSLAAVILVATLGLDAPSPLWSGLEGDIARPLSLALAGLFVLYAVYRLSWGRAYRDTLTGLPGRRALEEHLARLGGVYTLVMLDVDHFKAFNDRYGHDVGDDVLKLVAAQLAEVKGGSAYRYGGEEFTLVFAGQRAPEVRERLEALREAIATRDLTLRVGRNRSRRGRGKQVRVTASFGAADRNDSRKTPAQVLKASDQALYRAKKGGRNAVVLG